MLERKKWYFYHYEITVPDPISRENYIQRLMYIADVDGDPKPMDDPLLIIVRFKVEDQSKTNAKTTELKTVFNKCGIVECSGYIHRKSTEQRNLEKQKRDRIMNSIYYGGGIYLITLFGSSGIQTLFNQLSLNSLPSLESWADPLFRASMVAIPPSVVVSLKKFRE